MAFIKFVLAVGPVHVRSQLRPLLTSWRGAFPHSVKEMTKEQASGSLQSWLVALENRTGALTCKLGWMHVSRDGANAPYISIHYKCACLAVVVLSVPTAIDTGLSFLAMG